MRIGAATGMLQKLKSKGLILKTIEVMKTVADSEYFYFFEGRFFFEKLAVL